MQKTTRVQVIGLDNKPKMPTTPARARKWIKTGKATSKRSKLGVFYVQLTQNADDNVQPIIAGVDRGKCFTGIAFQFIKSETKTAAAIRSVTGVVSRL